MKTVKKKPVDIMETTCRLCAKERPLKQLRRSFNDSALNIQQKLIDCCRWNSIVPIEYDSLPKRVCSVCYRKLDLSWSFAESVARAQEQLISMIGEEKPVLAPIEHVNIQNTLIKDEPDEIDDEFDESIAENKDVPAFANVLKKTEAPIVSDHLIESHSSRDEKLLVRLNLPENNFNFGDDYEDEPPSPAPPAPPSPAPPPPLLDNDPDFSDANDSKSESSNESNDNEPLPVKPKKRRYDAKNIDWDEIRRKRLQKIPGSLSRLCDTCGMVFSNTCTLRRHAATHFQKLKPHECKTCGKRFRDASSLKVSELKNNSM